MQSIILKFSLAEHAHLCDRMTFFLPAKSPSLEGVASIAVDEITGTRFLYERPYADIDSVRGVRVLWPRFAIGDRIYVKETWGYDTDTFETALENTDFIRYWGKDAEPCSGWKDPASMPVEAARTFFTVNDIKPMRLHEITEEIALNTGIERMGEGFVNYMHLSRFDASVKMQKRAEAWPQKEMSYETARDSFASMWESYTRHDMVNTIGWGANPCVWLIALKK